MLDNEYNGFGLVSQENEDFDMEDNQDFFDDSMEDEEFMEDEECQDGLADPDGEEGEMTFVDQDGDGYTETTIITYDDINEDGVVRAHEVHIDTDSDGIDDYHATYVEVDTNNSGEVDTMIGMVDSDGDGQIDTYEKYNDYDQDGEVDNVKIYTDENSDGEFDTMEKLYDSDGDGVIDTSELYVDENGDGILDHHEMYNYDPESGQLASSNDYDYDNDDEVYHMDVEQYDPSTVSDPDMVLGTPDDSMEYWEYQGENGPCALYAQMFVIEELTGEEIDIDEFINEASENGWYEDGEGTAVLNMNQMLDYYDIDNEMGFNKSVDDIVECLNDGGKVIVSLDANQIWFGEDTDIFSPASGANHAVEVIGIDNSDPDNPMVILNDSGHPNGQGELVPLDVFEDAWNEGDRQMIVCYPS